jgi:hypothetical protein
VKAQGMIKVRTQRLHGTYSETGEPMSDQSPWLVTLDLGIENQYIPGYAYSSKLLQGRAADDGFGNLVCVGRWH